MDLKSAGKRLLDLVAAQPKRHTKKWFDKLKRRLKAPGQYEFRRKVINYHTSHPHPATMSASRRRKLRRT